MNRSRWPQLMPGAASPSNVDWSLEDHEQNAEAGPATLMRGSEERNVLSSPDLKIQRNRKFSNVLQKRPYTTQAEYQSSRSPRNCIRATRKTLLACIPDTRWTVCLEVSLVLQLLICAAFETQIAIQYSPIIGPIVYLSHNKASLMVQAQLATVIFETCYQLVLGLNAVRMRNIVNAIGVCVNNTSILVFVVLAGVGIDQGMRDRGGYTPHDAQEYKIYKLGSISVFRRGFGGLVAALALCTLVISFVTCKLYGQFAWAIYRHISTANGVMRRSYLMYEILISLLHLDFFFILGFWVQYLAETAIGTLAMGTPMLVIAPFQLFFTGRFVRREQRVGCYFMMFLLLGQIAVLAWGVSLAYVTRMDDDPAIIRTTAYACLALPVLSATMVMMVVCMKNFGKGLKPFLSRNQVSSDTQVAADSYADFMKTDKGFEYQELSKLAPARMELD